MSDSESLDLQSPVDGTSSVEEIARWITRLLALHEQHAGDAATVARIQEAGRQARALLELVTARQVPWIERDGQSEGKSPPGPPA